MWLILIKIFDQKYITGSKWRPHLGNMENNSVWYINIYSTELGLP